MRFLFLVDDSPAFCAAHEIFHGADREARRNTALLIDILAFARFKGDHFHQFTHEGRHSDTLQLLFRMMRFELRYLHSECDAFRIVCDNLTLDTVFQWSDNTSAIGVIFRVSRKNELNVERQS